MKYFLTCVFVWLIANTCLAGPADSRLTKSIKLPSGEMVTVRLIGDEFGSYLQDVSSNRCFTYEAEGKEYRLLNHVVVRFNTIGKSNIVVSSINGARIYAGNKAIESLELPYPGVYIISINGRESKIIAK